MSARALIASLALLTGCAYRMPPRAPPSVERLRIVSPSPEDYSLRLSINQREYAVPSDGRVTLQVPAMGGPCGVYLFNKIKVSGGDNLLTAKTLVVAEKGKRVRRLSLNEIAALPVDGEGFHLLAIRK